MKVTLDLDDNLYQQVKVHAAEKNLTVTSVVEDALRRLLPERAQVRLPVNLPQSKEAGWILEGVNINDASSVRDFLDD
jgi:hypothetical protein